MKIGLVPWRFKNGDIAFNMAQIERAMKEARGRADLLCFGEAFLQGFDSLCWDHETDMRTAVSQESELMAKLRRWTAEYGAALLLGYIERDGESLYSSCIVLEGGNILHNYRRISEGWKLPEKADGHYREDTDTAGFRFHGRDITIALCGDLWAKPEEFKVDGLLIWPVFCNYAPDEWEKTELAAYAAHAASFADDTLVINSIDESCGSVGGAFWFRRSAVKERTAFGEERILFVELDD